MTSWCDKLASVPTVGLTLDFKFISSGSLLDAISPFLNDMASGLNPEFTITKNEPGAIQIVGNNGFQYGIEPSKVVILFNHRLKAKHVSGGPPIMELLSDPKPFTELLVQSIDKIEAVLGKIPGYSSRKLRRIGIVSTTHVDSEEAPPGVHGILGMIGRPWGKILAPYHIQFLTELTKGEHTKDRCIHTFLKSEDPEELSVITLDWQRVFDPPRVVGTAPLHRILLEAQTAALAYFEELAEGTMLAETSGVLIEAER